MSLGVRRADPHEEDVALECQTLKLAIRRAKLNLSTLQQRSATFWGRIADCEEEDSLWLEAQQHVWAEQRGVYEEACLNPLSTCVAELRRWQGVRTRT